MVIIDALAVAGILFGLFFFVVGVVGLMRFEDVYARIHAAGKVSTLGQMGLMLATALLLPETTVKLILLAAFIVITAPVGSHAIANAAHRTGVPMKSAVRDDLAASHAPPGVPAADETS